MKRPSEQLEALSVIVLNEIKKVISEQSWVIKQTNDYQLRLTRKIPPCEGFDIFIDVIPEHRHVDTNMVQNIDTKAKEIVIDKIIAGKGNILEDMMKSNVNILDGAEVQPDVMGALSDPAKMMDLVRQVKENIAKRKSEEKNGIE